MRQPEDTKTLELLPEQKRGRGRPRAENPLTPAERAKRYREKRLLNSDAKIVTENNVSDDVEFWRGMYEAEVERVAELEARIAAGRGKSYSYALVTEITEIRIIEFMGKGARAKDDYSSAQFRSWAYGAYLSWSRLTDGCQAEGDDKRLADLTTFY
jgi:hypothetical protein